MIDTIVILFSTLMCLLVVFRAIRLDAQEPWYGSAEADRKAARKPARRIWQGDGEGDAEGDAGGA